MNRICTKKPGRGNLVHEICELQSLEKRRSAYGAGMDKPRWMGVGWVEWFGRLDIARMALVSVLSLPEHILNAVGPMVRCDVLFVGIHSTCWNLSYREAYP